MNSQLLWITSLLNKNIKNYFLEGGSLLGLMREGELLEHDNDIDIIIWDEDEKYLIDLLPKIKEKGYKIYISAYNDINFKYNFKNKKVKYVIDISIFRKNNGYGWCLQPLLNLKTQKEKNRKSSQRTKKTKNLHKKVLGNLFNKFRNFFLFKNFNSFPWNLLYRLETWWIPLELIEESILNKKFGVRIPNNWKGYLSYRYGIWKVPNKEWCFWIDDKGLRHEHFEDIFKNF